MTKRLFGALGALWVLMAVPLVLFWFAFNNQPWSVPFADFTDPVQLMLAAVVYGLPLIMAILFLADQLQAWKSNAQD